MTITTTFPPLKRPTKLEWIYPSVAVDQSWDSRIISKSSRKIATRLDEILAENKLVVTLKLLDATSFQEWLPYYSQKMTEQNHSVIATPAWIEQKLSDAVAVYLIDFAQNGVRIGTSVFSVTAQDKYIEHFKASDRLHISNLKNASLGTVIDLYYLRHAMTSHASVVSSGSSRNGFGFYNNLGYLAFKIKLGYRPVIAEVAEFDENFEYDSEQACIWFATQDQQQLEVMMRKKELINQEMSSLIDLLNLPQREVETISV